MCPDQPTSDTTTFRVTSHPRGRSIGRAILIVTCGFSHNNTAETMHISQDGGAVLVSDGRYNRTDDPRVTMELLETLSNYYNTPTCTSDDAPVFRHINGNLGYLYRPPVICRHIKRLKRRIIHQPCWRRNRWKSLT